MYWIDDLSYHDIDNYNFIKKFKNADICNFSDVINFCTQKCLALEAFINSCERNTLLIIPRGHELIKEHFIDNFVNNYVYIMPGHEALTKLPKEYINITTSRMDTFLLKEDNED